jgi:hypothetical protein
MAGSSPSRRLGAGIVLALVAGLLGPGAGLGLAAFADAAQAPSTLTTAACFPGDSTAPTVDATVVSKNVQYLPGYVRQGGGYHVYASVSDVGCGVSTVRANVSALTAGSTAVTLPVGTFAVGGMSFQRRSASVTAKTPLGEGTFSYSITATDLAGNVATTGGFTMVVDNTRPSGVNIQTANGGLTVGLAEAGDSVTFGFSEIVDPQSVLAGWNGSPTKVVPRLTNNASADRLTIRNAANTANLPLGTVSLAANYVSATRDFGATGTQSTMTWAGDSITITFGTPSGARLTNVVASAMIWPPVTTVTDRAGNTSLTTSVTEPSFLDVEF